MAAPPTNMIYIGTSGYKYPDWRGAFYPAEVKDQDMLSYYVTQFPVVELDFTYYQMPGIRTMAGIEKKSPEGFIFCVKANRAMTHEVPGEGEVQDVFQRFLLALSPMIQAGKLGCLLAQFPWSFQPTAPNRDYIKKFRDWTGDIPLVVEFRHIGWLTQETYQFLKEQELAYCAVDEPPLKGLLPPLAVVTAPIAYVRFHGRNKEKWWKHKEAWERYNYLYSREELAQWLPRIMKMASQATKTYVLFNNCHAGHAAANARLLKAMLEEV
ncbi:MAG: DUF72 domain-containing protein [Firmicutes bacterium]|nr:DUF72 domain-containing protein [Bacillota bacterium]